MFRKLEHLEKEQTELSILEKQVNDNKMIFTLSLAVCYCFCLTVVCGFYAFNTEAFTGNASDCYVNDQD